MPPLNESDSFPYSFILVLGSWMRTPPTERRGSWLQYMQNKVNSINALQLDTEDYSYAGILLIARKDSTSMHPSLLYLTKFETSFRA